MGPFGWIAVSAAVVAGWIMFGRKRPVPSEAQERPPLFDPDPIPPSSEPRMVSYGMPDKAAIKTIGNEGSTQIYWQETFPVGNDEAPEGGYDSFHVYLTQPGGVWIFVRRKRGDRVAQGWVKLTGVNDSDSTCGNANFAGATITQEGPGTKGTAFEFREASIDIMATNYTGTKYLVGSMKLKVIKNIGDVEIYATNGKLCATASRGNILGAVEAP